MLEDTLKSLRGIAPLLAEAGLLSEAQAAPHIDG